MITEDFHLDFHLLVASTESMLALLLTHFFFSCVTALFTGLAALAVQFAMRFPRLGYFDRISSLQLSIKAESFFYEFIVFSILNISKYIHKSLMLWIYPYNQSYPCLLVNKASQLFSANWRQHNWRLILSCLAEFWLCKDRDKTAYHYFAIAYPALGGLAGPHTIVTHGPEQRARLGTGRNT
jgi:hypothetical protein